MPPGFGDSRSDTPKYACCPSTAPPHWPPSPLPWPMRYCHTMCAFVVGIERVGHPRLLRKHEQIAAVHRDEARRSREVEVGSERRRAVRVVGIHRPAAQRPVVVRRDLVHPLARAAVHVERDARRRSSAATDRRSRCRWRRRPCCAWDRSWATTRCRRPPGPTAARRPCSCRAASIRRSCRSSTAPAPVLASSADDAAAERAALRTSRCRPGLLRSAPARRTNTLPP